jgi:capsular exopolysaccharide synthesis family protein
MVTMNRPSLQNLVALENEPDDANSSDFSGYIALLKRRLWLLVLVPLLLAFCAYSVTSLPKATYDATATLLVSPTGGQNGAPPTDATTATLLTQTYSALVTAPPVLQGVVTDLHLHETPTELASLVTVAPEPSSAVIRISTKYSSPQVAADISNAIGAHFITFLTDLQKTGVSQSSQAIRDSVNKARSDRDNVSAQLAALRAGPNTPTPEEDAQIANLDSLRAQYQSTYSSLLDLQQRMDVAQLTTQNAVSLVVRALPPQGPVRSLRLIATAGALLAGFGATVVGIVLSEQVNPRVRSRKDVRNAADLPLLATVPRTHSRNTIEVIHEPRSSMSQAIYSIQTQIWLEARTNEATIITVTSPGSEEGASVIAANLAVAFAQAGQRVALVDGDLRHPSLWKPFKKDAKHPGLAELIAVPALAPQDVLANGPHDGLQLLLAGPVSVIPTERLIGERLESILADLRHRADVVIIGAPPLLTDSDTLLFAANADHVVVVTRANHTRMDALRTTLASIRAMRVNILGLVLYDADRDGSLA